MLKGILMSKRFNLAIILAMVFYGSVAQSARPVPAAYFPAISRSFVRTWTATAPEQMPNNLALRPLSDVKQSTEYVDGLGRPLQTVGKRGSLKTDPLNPGSSLGAVDVIAAVEYDVFGRELFKYLPTPSTATGATAIDGNLKLDPLSQQATFYNAGSSTSPLYGQNETFFYGQTVVESSPLARVVETAAPGNSWTGTMWQPGEANHRSVKYKSYVNTTTDGVRIWDVRPGIAGTFSSYSSPGAYAAGLLYKNVITDEAGMQVIEFKDKDGKIILKKVQIDPTVTDNGTTGKNHIGWLCTYYLYDDLNNLRCVVQPRGVELISPSWALSDPIILAEQCFLYEYDYRNRMIIKKVPGAGAVYMVYDARDRLVMTQDANLRLPAANKWLVTIFDNVNRPIQTGFLSNTWNNNTFQLHLSAAANSSAYPFTAATVPATIYWEYLTKTGYDDYSATPAASGLTPAMDNTTNTATYLLTPYNTAPSYAQKVQTVASSQTEGLVTWTETKVLGTTASLYTVVLYDETGRTIQVKSRNLTTGTDIITYQYNWSGQPVITVMKQEKAGTYPQTSVVVTKMTYDDLGRLVQTDKKIQHTLVNANALPGSFTTIATNQYDALGQLKQKKLAPAFNAGAGLQPLTYDYNIRGWLLGINRVNLSANDQSPTLFGFELGYDKLSNTSSRNYLAAQWNGNITGITWKSNGDGIRRKYDFTYDAANRLMQAAFEQNNQGTVWDRSLADYTVKMGDGITPSTAYDANGNITQMQQWGLKLNGPAQIDNLTYSYLNTKYSNRLQQVTDLANDNLSKLGDFKYDPATKTATDYSYDVNGNLTADLNKKISSITYNYLNLPSVITVTGKGSITYTYDAAGNKLKKVGVDVTAPGKTITTTTTYLAGTVFETRLTSPAAATDYTDKLLFISQEEGRIRFTPAAGTVAAKFNYDYFIKDHLGNVRMVLTDELQVDKYPAATMEGASATKEETFYSNIPSTRVTAPAAYPANTPAGNTNVAKVSGAAGSQKTGPAIMLKVMSGDRFNLQVSSWWSSANTPGTPVSPIQDLADALTSGLTGVSENKATTADLAGSGLPLTAATAFLANQPVIATKPKAYINWILLDEQFKIVKNASGNIVGSGSEQVGSSGAFTAHLRTNMPVSKNGYLYIYVSNETANIDVFFDNLQVTHVRGPILEETHYYPFGLTMAGISSKAAGGLENRRKWNGASELVNKNFSDGTGLEFYETFYRTLDPQLGRFWQIDPETEAQESNSSYESMGNNPISNVDPLGDFKTKFGAWWHSLWHGGVVGRNKFGEYFTRKTETSTTANGGPTVTAKMTYGKGRNAYSTVIGPLLEDAHALADIQMYGENSMYQMYDSPEDAGKAALSYTGLLLPNPIIRATNNVINSSKLASAGRKIIQSIGKTISQKQLRHVAGTAKQGGSYLNSVNDAQKILDAVHSGEAVFLGTTKNGHPVFRYSGVTGTNVNLGAGFSGQATDIFIIKGTISPSVVPTSPAWLP